MTRWTSWENQKAPSLTWGDFKAMVEQKQHLWVRHFVSSGLRSPISHLLFCTWGQLTRRFSQCSARFPPLALWLLFPHFLSFWPQKERKGSLSRAVSFSFRAAEKEAEDLTRHAGPCGGALMAEWDAIPCYGVGVNSFDYTDYPLIHTWPCYWIVGTWRGRRLRSL